MADPSLCRRCGKCCCQKMLCTIYDRRHEMNVRCLTVEEGIHHGVFPPDCPYVSDLPGYVPPREECTEEELREYFEHGGSDQGPGTRD